MRFKVELAATILALTTIAGCAASADGGEGVDGEKEGEVALTSEGLFHVGDAWENGFVPVCTGLGTDDSLIARTNAILLNSWERAANVAVGIFKADNCDSAQLAGIPQLKFIANTNGLTSGGLGATGSTISIISNDSPVPYNHFQYEVIHEFGHVLSFAHEQERPDNWDSNGNPIYCGQLDNGKKARSGTTLTDFDKKSVMNYCAGTPIRLSTLDMIGARALYGRNPNMHGFMIVNDADPSLAFNAWGGAKEGTVLRLSSQCTVTNPDCTWSYQNGMLVSDKDPTLAINAWGGAKSGTTLKLTALCKPSNPDCTWTYSKGEWLSDRDPTLAIGAITSPFQGSTMTLRTSCTPSDTGCTWTLPNIMLQSWMAPTMALNAFGGAAYGTEIKFHDACTVGNPDCTFTWTQGMLLSDADSSLRVNAWGGAAGGTAVRLHNRCRASNPDCTWTWHQGEILSDRGNFAMWPSFPDTAGSVILQTACSTSDSRCLFSAQSAR